MVSGSTAGRPWGNTMTSVQRVDTWVHLRLCLECGHVGCCDSSKNKHATKHFHGTQHPIMQSFQPGEDWRWCYVDQEYVDQGQSQVPCAGWTLRAFLLVVCFLTLPRPAGAQPRLTTSPSGGTPWHGQWIGLVRSQTVADLSNASWIWFPEAGVDLTRNAPVGTRYFRHRLDLPPGAVIRSAVAVVSANNEETLFVNGVQADHNTAWEAPHVVNIARYLVPGANIIAFAGYNGMGEPINAAGLIGTISVRTRDPSPITLSTDATWKSVWTPCPPAGRRWILMTAPEPPCRRDRQERHRALGTTRRGPGGLGQANLWTCFRKSFRLTMRPATATARIAVDSKYWLWVNGKLAIFEGGLSEARRRRTRIMTRWTWPRTCTRAATRWRCCAGTSARRASATRAAANRAWPSI